MNELAIEFSEKFVAFVDILGFKELVKAAENKNGITLEELLGLQKELGNSKSKEIYIQYGPEVCPGSKRIRKDLDFEIAQVSDCVLISVEVSPAGLINLLAHCSSLILKLMNKGAMCRGYITQGLIYHKGIDFIGSAHIDAYSNEREVIAFRETIDEKGTPFVELNPLVVNYVNQCEDKCVKEIYSRMVLSDGTVEALYPFKRLSHSFAIGGHSPQEKFNPEREKKSVEVVRGWITNYKTKILANVDSNNPNAMNKVKHYLKALDNQLEMCEKTDRAIDDLGSPFGAKL